MYKYFILFLFVFPLTLAAQTEDKKIIGIASVEYNGDYKDAAVQLQDIVTHAFSENKDIELLDRTKVLQIQNELKLQKGKGYVEGKTVKQNEEHGAQFLVLGNLDNITIVKNNPEKTTGYNPFTKKNDVSSSAPTITINVNFSLQMSDVKTGEVQFQQSFLVGKTFEVHSAENVNNQNAISVIENVILPKVEDWVNKIFPPTFKIASIDERNRKGEPKVISIVVDQKLNIKPKYIINVNEVSKINVGGRERTKIAKIASITVTKIEGDFLVCEVLDGSDILEEKIKNNGENLQLELTDQKATQNIFSIIAR